jgi:hypothetical protein
MCHSVGKTLDPSVNRLAGGIAIGQDAGREDR